MSKHESTVDCPYCLDGYQPVGTNGLLGTMYQACDQCARTGQSVYRACASCQGTALFPTDFDCRSCLAKHLESFGFYPVFCGDCGGITDLGPLGPPWEVTP